MTARRICTWSNENTVSAATPSPTVCRQDFIDDGEDVDAAALRELREETGVEPIDENSCDIDHVGQFYSSEGMTDELANIMVVHLRHWQAVERHFDADEHVESAWIPWKQLRDTHITASNSEIAILHEQIRRMRQQ